MDDACAAFLSRLGKQHQAFLAEANKGLLKTLRQENRRLQEEVRTLREARGEVRRGGSKEPAVPPAQQHLQPKLPDHPPGLLIGQGFALPKPLIVEEDFNWGGYLGPRSAHPSADPTHNTTVVSVQGAVVPPPAVAHVVWDPHLPGTPDEGAPILPLTNGAGRGGGHDDSPHDPEGGMTPMTPASSVARKRERKMTQIAGIVVPVAAESEGFAQEEKRREKTMKRMRDLMGLGHEEATIGPEDIARALHSRFRGQMEQEAEAAHEFFHEVLRIMGIKEARGFLPLFDLWEVLARADFMADVRDSLQDSVGRTYRVLMTPTIDEVLDEVARAEAQPEDPRKQAARVMLGRKKKRYRWEGPLGMVTSATVVVSMVVMGMSMDVQPGFLGWVVIETIIAGIFLFEMLIKLVAFGPRWYFLSEGCEWNYLDFVITFLSLFDVTMSITTLVVEESQQTGGKLVSGAKMLTVLRVLRMARILRLMKLLNSALLKDLANMLSGILIGAPALFWVVMLLSMVIFTLGMTFRTLLGPAEGQDLLAICGDPDNYSGDDPACSAHLVYGEVYFGTVTKSMFTIFRWMMQDYTSKGGVTLSCVFSDAYGPVFDLLFVTGMILIFFGLFNVITAIFVDGTIAGLKYNEIKRKYARMSEYAFVKNALSKLVNRIIEIKMSIDPELAEDPNADMESMEVFELTASQFNFVLRDDGVLKDLENLDVSMYSPAGLMDTFDPQGTGIVTLAAFVKAIMKLRGEPQKSDAIATLLSLQTVQDRLHFLEDRLSNLKPQEAAERFPFG